MLKFGPNSSLKIPSCMVRSASLYKFLSGLANECPKDALVSIKTYYIMSLKNALRALISIFYSCQGSNLSNVGLGFFPIGLT